MIQPFPKHPWSTERADQKFSERIRQRDRMCVRCKIRPATDCSHFWERGHSATRWDEDNADGLCRICHQIFEGRINGYKEFKLERIGQERYARLEKLHNMTVKRSDYILKFMKTCQRRES